MAIRALIFDFGGVLYFPPDSRWLRRWQGVLGLKQDPVLNEMFTDPEQSDYLRRVFTGEISETQVWAGLARRWHVSPWLVSRIRKSGFSQKRFNQEMAQFVRSLRPAYQTAILSNAGDQGRRYFSDAYGIDRLVDLVMISAEEGVAKPDERIYRLALERLQVQPDQAVFVDDLACNVAAAQALGMGAVLFQNTQQALHDIQTFLDGRN